MVATNSDDGIDLIKRSAKCAVIVSGSLFDELIHRIHHAENVQSICVFTGQGRIKEIQATAARCKFSKVTDLVVDYKKIGEAASKNLKNAKLAKSSWDNSSKES